MSSQNRTCSYAGDVLYLAPGGGHGNPLQYFCLENPLHRGTWQAMGHNVAKTRTQLKWLSMHACPIPWSGLQCFILALHMAKSCPLLRTQCRQHLLREVFFVLTPSSTRRVMNFSWCPNNMLLFSFVKYSSDGTITISFVSISLLRWKHLRLIAKC